MEFLKDLFKKKEGGNNSKDHDGEKEKELTIKPFLNPKKDNFKECVICLEEMKQGEELAIIMCSHIYHLKCINSWSERKRLCPLCDYSF